jgi:leader peptidase (prepilin peptidase)/N-methyltransferase
VHLSAKACIVVDMNDYRLLVTIGFFAIGLVAGCVGRRLLGRLRRGAVFRPPGCELVAGLLSATLGWRLVAGAVPSWWLAVPLLLGWLAVPLAVADLAVRRLPDALTIAAYPILGCALFVAALRGSDHDLGWHALLGAALFGGVHLVARMYAPTALGGGDVKLAGSLGAVLGALGWGAVITAALIAAVVTLGLAVSPWGSRASPSRNHTQPLLNRARSPAWSPHDRIPLLRRSAPHGPGLLAATWLVAAFPGPGLAGGWA